MGQINDDIEAILADDVTYPDRASKRQAIGLVRKNGWENRLNNALPWTLPLDANREVEFTGNLVFGTTPEGTDFVSCDVVFRRNNVIEETVTPWKIVKPPVLVPDAGGEVDRGEGNVYREDLLEALRQICDRRFP